jgi:hypothetical protein
MLRCSGNTATALAVKAPLTTMMRSAATIFESAPRFSGAVVSKLIWIWSAGPQRLFRAKGS